MALSKWQKIKSEEEKRIYGFPVTCQIFARESGLVGQGVVVESKSSRFPVPRYKVFGDLRIEIVENPVINIGL